MKKIVFLFALMLSVNTLTGNAQNNDITKFLGIPIDGTKTEMIQKLQSKGFILKEKGTETEHMEGEFNGQKVNLHLATNNRKMCRIMVADKTLLGETDIRIRFNNLLSQFENNVNYEASPINEYIDEDEDISYEMTCHNKRYEATFYQKSKEDKILLKPNWDKLVMRSVWFMIAEYYGKYYITMFYDNEYNRANGEDL